MGVERLLPPLIIPPPNKCGNSPSTATNSTCPSTSRRFDYYGPWTLASRIPIPPNTSTCNQPYTFDTARDSVAGSANVSAPGSIHFDQADLNIYNSQQPGSATPPGVSGGGANPGPDNPPDYPRSLNLPSDFISQVNRTENSAWSIGRTGREFFDLNRYEECNTVEKTNIGGIFRVLGSDGSVQTFGDMNSANAAMPGMMNNLDKLSEDTVKTLHDNWNQLNSQKTATFYQSNDMVLDQLSINYQVSDALSFSIAPIVGYGAETTVQGSQSVSLSVTQSSTPRSGGGGGRGKGGGGTGGGVTYGNHTVTSNQTQGEPQVRDHFRAGLSLSANLQLGDWNIEGIINHSRSGRSGFGKTAGLLQCYSTF